MKTLRALQELDKRTEADVYVVGGFVRDFLRNEKNYDLDVVVRNLPIKKIQEFLRKYGKTKMVKLSKIKNSFNVEVMLFQGHKDNMVAQIKLPARGKRQIQDPNNTLRQDSLHRDYTINALYMPILAKSRSEIIDYVNGRKDLSEHKIKAVGNAEERVEEHPGRIMRAISLAARTGFHIDENTLYALKRGVERGYLKKIPKDHIRNELNHIFLCKKPSKYFKLMHTLGILKEIMPELDDCVDVYQDKRYHKWDVFHHCLYTGDNIEPNIILRIAGILHDIGKPPTREVSKEKGVTFHKHDMAGVKLAKKLLTRLGYENKVKKEVLKLIRLHMYHYTRNYSDKAILRFIKKAEITDDNINNLGDFPLFKLRAAERLGNGFKKVPVTLKQKDFEERIIKVYKKSTALKISDLNIDGKVIMSVFNLEQSEMIGKILKYLITKVQDAALKNQDINNRIELTKLVAEYLLKHSQK